MPWLEDVSYSREETITAVREYYRFLTQMYLDEAAVIEPPESGWPFISAENLPGMDKTDEVFELLRHLPYIGSRDDSNEVLGAPWCRFADWHSLSAWVARRGADSEENFKITSEGGIYYEEVPSHVIGLASGGRDNEIFLLDTKLGVVYWLECNGQIKDNPSREGIQDDAYDYAAENEADWRADSGVWSIPDFFEILKDQYRALKFLPMNNRIVKDIYTTYGARDEGFIPMLQDIYREHGWPDLERYRKRECLEAVQKALEDQYPWIAE